MGSALLGAVLKVGTFKVVSRPQHTIIAGCIASAPVLSHTTRAGAFARARSMFEVRPHMLPAWHLT